MCSEGDRVCGTAELAAVTPAVNLKSKDSLNEREIPTKAYSGVHNG